MEEDFPSEFHISFTVEDNGLKRINRLSSAFSKEEKKLFENRIPIVRTKRGDYELYKELGEVVSDTPARYVHYRLLDKKINF